MPQLVSGKLALATVALVVFLSACSRGSSAGAQASGGSSSTAPQLTPYTAPDQSASAGVPPGWNVTKGTDTVITMTGPNSETILLGNTLIVRNAPFQLGQHSNGIDLSMPNSDTLAQKFTMAMQQGAAIGGQPAPQISITSATPMQLPASLGQCGRIIASSTSASGPMTIVALMCSLPVDTGGTYKVMFKLAQAPPAIASKEGAIASAVFASYRVPSAMLQRKLAPNTPSPAATAASIKAMNNATSSMINSMAGANNSANCFDLAVIRETPTYQLPRSCGGMQPN